MPHTAKKPNLAARSGLLTSSTSELRCKTPYKICSAFFTGYFDISESYAEIQMCKWKKGLKWPLKNPFSERRIRLPFKQQHRLHEDGLHNNQHIDMSLESMGSKSALSGDHRRIASCCICIGSRPNCPVGRFGLGGSCPVNGGNDQPCLLEIALETHQQWYGGFGWVLWQTFAWISVVKPLLGCRFWCRQAGYFVLSQQRRTGKLSKAIVLSSTVLPEQSDTCEKHCDCPQSLCIGSGYRQLQDTWRSIVWKQCNQNKIGYTYGLLQYGANGDSAYYFKM